MSARREVLGFTAVGLVAFATQLGSFDLLVRGGAGPLTANALATVLSVAVAYVGNRYLAYGHRRSGNVRREALAFAGVNLLAWLLGEAVLATAYPLGLQHDRTVVNVLDVAGIGVGTVVRFAAYRTLVFRPRADATGTGVRTNTRTPVPAAAPER